MVENTLHVCHSHDSNTYIWWVYSENPLTMDKIFFYVHPRFDNDNEIRTLHLIFKKSIIAFDKS